MQIVGLSYISEKRLLLASATSPPGAVRFVY